MSSDHSLWTIWAVFLNPLHVKERDWEADRRKLMQNTKSRDNVSYLGCVRLGNLDLDFKIRISDLQSNAKSENGFQR